MVGRGARQLSALNGNMARAHPRGPAGIDQPPDPCRLFQTPGTRLAGFRAGVPLLTLSGQQGPPTFLPAQATDNRGVQLRWVGRGSGASEVKPRGRRTTVALETVGNWYWIVDEIEQAGCIPFLAHAAKAKVMMGNIHKTDKLDAQGLATLLYLGKLPSVWIPPAVVRDERELPRTRMAFAKHRTMVKNRIRSTRAKYPLSPDTDSDISPPSGAQSWKPLCGAFPLRPSAVCASIFNSWTPSTSTSGSWKLESSSASKLPPPSNWFSPSQVLPRCWPSSSTVNWARSIASPPLTTSPATAAWSPGSAPAPAQRPFRLRRRSGPLPGRINLLGSQEG